MDNPQERRTSQRVEVLLKVEYLDPADMLSDYISNLGDGGIRIHTSLPFALGEELQFALSFPGLVDPVVFRGRVRWRRPETAPGGAAVGVEFLFQSEKHRQWVADLVRCLAEDSELEVQAEATPFRVLIVEDNDFVQELFQHAVARFQSDSAASALVEILAARDAPAALQIIHHTSIDLAIIDHFMPGMTGCEFVQHLRVDRGLDKLPVLVVSVGGEEIREQAYRAGADLYLQKPIVLRQLVETIGSLVARAGQQRRLETPT